MNDRPTNDFERSVGTGNIVTQSSQPTESLLLSSITTATTTQSTAVTKYTQQQQHKVLPLPNIPSVLVVVLHNYKRERARAL